MAFAFADRLESWKEIAAYLQRGVRTARRWERDEGLPVHRHVHRVLGTVYASKSEIDAWRNARGTQTRSASARPSIAVLPFANLSADPGDAYFADGLTEEVTARLATVAALRVISRTSSMSYKETAKSTKTIGGELDVRYVLEGSARRDGERIRIAAQLIDARADHHVWADTYDGTTADIFAFQEQLARTIVEALRLRLTAAESRRLSDRPINDLHAYECYVRARQQSWRWRADAIDHAVQLLHNGLSIIGDNAELQAALGLTYLQYREAGIDYGERPLREAERCAQHVFAARHAPAAGLRLRGWIHYTRGRIQSAVQDLREALQAEPQNADTLLLLSNCRLISGKVPEARPLLARLLSVDPLTPISRCMPAFADLLDGHFGAAVAPYQQMFEMDPGNPMARLFLTFALMMDGQLDAARALVNGAPDEIRATVPGAAAAFLAGVTTRVEPGIEAVANTSDFFARMLAHGYARAGDFDRTLHWLRVAVDRGFINYAFLAHHDPLLAPWRSKRQFVGLMTEVRKRCDAFQP